MRPLSTTVGQSAKLGARFCSNDMNSASPFAVRDNDRSNNFLSFFSIRPL